MPRRRKTTPNNPTHSLSRGTDIQSSKSSNDLVRDLGLSKKLASQLEDKNLLKSETQVTYLRQREKKMFTIF